MFNRLINLLIKKSSPASVPPVRIMLATMSPEDRRIAREWIGNRPL